MTSNTPTFPKGFSENVILLYQNGKANGVVACGDDHPSTDLLKPFPAEEMKAWPVSQDVGNVRNNRPELVEPIPSVSPYSKGDRLSRLTG